MQNISFKGDETSLGAFKKPTLSRWLTEDARKAPEVFSNVSQQDGDAVEIPISNYLSRAAHDAEMTRMWPKVWQMACHIQDIPTTGDYTTYEIGKKSFIIVNLGDGSFKAYRNACLHRGNQLMVGSGHATVMSCRFHGWTWNLDGSLRRITEDWDFAHLKREKFCLPEAQTGVWGGFLFINEDLDAPGLPAYLGELPAHFASAPLEDRRVAVHAAKVVPANWKVAMEAFMESYHVSPTHPQSVGVAEYAETQYDLYPDSPNISRLATISVAPASAATQAMTQQEFANYVAAATGREPVAVPDKQTFRQALAEHRRGEIAAAQGNVSVDHLTDVEMLDAIEYFLFPNFLPWHGFGLPIVYRFRPNGDNHESAIMEVYVLAPRDLAEPAPRAAAIAWLRPDQKFSDMAALSRLGPIFDQDYDNIVGVQTGMHSLERGTAVLGRYQERRIRHLHERIGFFING